MSPQKKTGWLTPATKIMINGLEILLHDQGWNCFVELKRKFTVCSCPAFLAVSVTRPARRGHTKLVNNFALHAGVYGVTIGSVGGRKMTEYEWSAVKNFNT